MKPACSWTTEDWSARKLAADFAHPHQGHEHWTDHVTVITKGPVRVEVDGEPDQVLDRGDAIVLRADQEHRFVPLHARGAEWRCVFSYEHAMRNGVSRENFDKDK
jgi:quercetin dioxygenase-like cupin family protein